MKEDLIELNNKLKQVNLERQEITFFDIFKENKNDENLISDWLSFIFNPNINGIGNRTIKALLKSICRDDIDIDLQDFISISREKSTDTRKRIDLLIKYSTNWIVIENKINSQENGTQTNAYHDYIIKEKNENDVIYIYLKPSYNKSKPSSKHFIQLDYESLIQELSKIQKEDYKENEKYKYRFLKEFEIVGEKYMDIREKDYIIDDEMKIYIENKETIQKLEKKYEEKDEKLIEFITKRVNETINKNNEFHIRLTKKWGCIQFAKQNWKNENGKGIHYEIWSEQIKSGLLGTKNVSCSICLHMENDIGTEILDEFGKYDIRKMQNTVEYTVKYLNFEAENIEKSIEDIVQAVKYLDDRYTNTIDEVMNKF